MAHPFDTPRQYPMRFRSMRPGWEPTPRTRTLELRDAADQAVEVDVTWLPLPIQPDDLAGWRDWIHGAPNDPPVFLKQDVDGRVIARPLRSLLTELGEVQFTEVDSTDALTEGTYHLRWH